MTDRWEAAAEAQIRTAQERGEFDNLPGMGKPLPGRDTPYDESWWITSFLEREQLPADLLLPTPLQLRRRLERVPDEVRDLPTEEAVRAYVRELNAEVVAWLRNPTGPQIAVRPANADEAVAQWRAARAPAPAPASASERVVAAPRRRAGWRFWRRRR